MKLRDFAGTWNGPLAVCALFALLALTGCTDHGPIGLYSKELFNKEIGPPRMSYSSYAQDGLDGDGSAYTDHVSVYLANTGGSSTYGVVTVVFSSSDTHVAFVPAPTDPSPTTTQQLGFFGSQGVELPANSGSTWMGEQGFVSSGVNIIYSPTWSFQFYYNGTIAGGANATPIYPTIYMDIKDPLGEEWKDQFQIEKCHSGC